jgi:hypothetical protein
MVSLTFVFLGYIHVTMMYDYLVSPVTPVPVRKDLFAWLCLAVIPKAMQQAIGSSFNNIVCLALLALTPTAKLQAIEVPKSGKFGGNHRLIHCCGNNRAD